jgi:glycosyltransferase involved in cell wall biosynthesis
MKVLIITQHYPPDLGASAFRLKALTNELIKRNHEVTVLTATPNRYSSLKVEEDKNVEEKIIRIPVKTGKDSALAQILRQLNFYLKMKKAAKGLCKENEFDIVIASSPPFLIGVAGISLKKYVKKLIIEIRDLWPDTVVDLGKAKESNPIIKIMRHYEKKMYKTADKIVTVLPFMNDRIASKGIQREKLITFTNGLDKYLMEEIEEWSDKKREARERLKIDANKFIISYVGNVGLGQNLEIFAKAAKKIRNVDFFIVGDGSDKARLLEMAKGVKNIHFIPPVPREQVPIYYAVSDVLFIHLANVKLFTDSLPSKTFEYAVSNRPIIYGLDGLSAEILDNCHAGIRIKRENEVELIEAINKIRRNYEHYQRLATEGKRYVVENYLRDEIVKKYVDFLEKII